MSATDGHLAVVPETNGGQPAIWTRGLTKRYRRVTALDDCSITVPEGRISALVGPNGAGKTTLLRMLAGLARPTTGSAAVLGARPRQDPAFLAGIGYLAQEIPLYRRLTAEDHIRAGARLNDRWDSAASRPRLLLLGEPAAALDPLARRHFLGALTAAVAEAAGELTVLLSSHLISELERVRDHIVLLANAQVQLCRDIADLLAGHQLLTGPRKDTADRGRTHDRARDRGRSPVDAARPARRPRARPRLPSVRGGLEDLVLGYLSASTPGNTHLAPAGEDR